MDILSENKPIKVLIVDDSPVVQSVLQKMLSKDRRIRVVGTAKDPYEAREKVVSLAPDVMTLDIEMPRMDGLTFLKKLMTHKPLPVLMVSSLTREGADLTVKALELGAVDVVNKPYSTSMEGMQELANDLIDKIKAASKARVRRYIPNMKLGTKPAAPSPTIARVRGVGYARAGVLTAPPDIRRAQHKIIAIGASTGGTEALRVVLERLPKETPGIVIVQHMPEHFTQAFANRMNTLCEIDVKEAEDGDIVRPGIALIAQGGKHMMLKKAGVEMRVSVRPGPLVCRHRPSVEVLFESVSRIAGPNAVGVMLTGMGGDGSQAMLAMRQAGALNICQDEASSVVFGMPKEAIKLGAAHQVEHLERIPQVILEFCVKR